MLGVKRMPRPLSESRKPESRRKTAVLRGMRLRRIDSPLDFPGQPCACGGGSGWRLSAPLARPVARGDVDLVHLVPVSGRLAKDRAMMTIELDPRDREPVLLW